MALSDEKFVSVSTYRKSGAAVATPTWIVELQDGRFGFWTSSQSGKVKRLRNNPRLSLTPSDSRGRVKPGSAALTATAELVTGGPEFEELQRKVRAKYGFMVGVSRLFNKIGHLGKGSFPYGDLAVLMRIDS
jgi:PPOX class probable F420-dependent enzyme